MTHQLLTALVRMFKLTTIAFLSASCRVGWTQTIEEILGKCRCTIESISSYEYTAHTTGFSGEEIRFFFTREGDAYRYDQKADMPEQIQRNLPVGMNWDKNAGEFKAGFDGLYYFEFNKENQLEKICSPPIRMAGVIEPFQSCFSWLTRTNSRAELLKQTRWVDFAKSCDGLVTKQQIQGHTCFVVTSGAEIGGRRYEIAFGEDVGYLPVRVRGLVGEDKKPVGESLFTEFKHFRIDGISFYFPSKFTSRSLVNGMVGWRVTELKPGSLNINHPVAYELLRLNYDPVGLD